MKRKLIESKLCGSNVNFFCFRDFANISTEHDSITLKVDQALELAIELMQFALDKTDLIFSEEEIAYWMKNNKVQNIADIKAMFDGIFEQRMKHFESIKRDSQ